MPRSVRLKIVLSNTSAVVLRQLLKYPRKHTVQKTIQYVDIKSLFPDQCLETNYVRLFNRDSLVTGLYANKVISNAKFQCWYLQFVTCILLYCFTITWYYYHIFEFEWF